MASYEILAGIFIGIFIVWVCESTEDKQVRVDANATNAIDVAGKDEAARQTT